MTYTPTHLTLQGIAVWLLLSKKNKAYYEKHRWEFLLINIVAILPDIDIFFGYHRSYTHSLILPTFFLLSLIIIDQFNKEPTSELSKGKKTLRFLKLSSLMWILHIFLDLSWGPLLLFWPLNSNFYDLSIYLRFENQPWLFFPLTFLGLIPDWQIYSMSEGERLFFINLSQQEREAIFGQNLDIYLEQFTLHLLIFLVWFMLILLPAFKKQKTEKRKEVSETIKKLEKFFLNFYNRLKKQLTLLGLFFIVLGLTLGPAIGSQKVMKYQLSSNYINTLTYFDPTLGVGFEQKAFVTTEITFQCETNYVDANFSLIVTNNDSFYNFFSAFDNLTQAYYQENITYSEMIESYKSSIEKVKQDTFLYLHFSEKNASNGVQIQMETENNTNLYLITFIDEWNITESFYYPSTILIEYIYKRNQAQIEGVILDVIGLTLIFSDQLAETLQQKRKKKNDRSMKSTL